MQERVNGLGLGVWTQSPLSTPTLISNQAILISSLFSLLYSTHYPRPLHLIISTNISNHCGHTFARLQRFFFFFFFFLYFFFFKFYFFFFFFFYIYIFIYFFIFFFFFFFLTVLLFFNCLIPILIFLNAIWSASISVCLGLGVRD